MISLQVNQDPAVPFCAAAEWDGARAWVEASGLFHLPRLWQRCLCADIADLRVELAVASATAPAAEAALLAALEAALPLAATELKIERA